MRDLIRTVTFAIALAFAAATHAKQGVAPRFTGGGDLVQPDVRSTDERFALSAEMQRRHIAQGPGQFAIAAQLESTAKALNGACGPRPDLIFKNGFEGINP